MNQVIAVSRLTKNYGKVQALCGVDLRVEPGLIYGLLGPNGAGKSTLIKAMVGAVRPTSGSVEVLGYTLPRFARKARKRLGYMPQVPAVYEDLTVRANITLFAQAHKLSSLQEKIDRALTVTGMDTLAARRVGTLSGGQKQRCSLACALVHEPDILFLDEPTAGVDPILKEGFWNHFRCLANSGTTIIISTHLMDEPLACDKIGILRQGRLIAEDRPTNILARGKTTVTIETEGNTITEPLEKAGPEALPEFLSRYGLSADVRRIILQQESLEEIFLRMIREGENHAQ